MRVTRASLMTIQIVYVKKSNNDQTNFLGVYVLHVIIFNFEIVNMYRNFMS